MGPSSSLKHLGLGKREAPSQHGLRQKYMLRSGKKDKVSGVYLRASCRQWKLGSNRLHELGNAPKTQGCPHKPLILESRSLNSRTPKPYISPIERLWILQTEPVKEPIKEPL